MNLTPEGQITIPLEIREQLGISSDTELEFEVENNRIYIQKKQPIDAIATWISTRRGTLQHMTTDQIMSLTRHDETP